MNHGLDLALFLCAWLGVALIYVFCIKDRTSDSVLVATWKASSYYTTLTNLLVAISISCQWILPDTIATDFFTNANVAAAITFYILTVAVANALMAGFKSPLTWRGLTDSLVHVITPVLAIAHWILMADKQALGYQDIHYWLIYPLTYALYTTVHGLWTEFYPYPFTNVKSLGWGKVGLNALGLSFGVLAGSTVFVALAINFGS